MGGGRSGPGSYVLLSQKLKLAQENCAKVTKKNELGISGSPGAISLLHLPSHTRARALASVEVYTLKHKTFHDVGGEVSAKSVFGSDWLNIRVTDVFIG